MVKRYEIEPFYAGYAPEGADPEVDFNAVESEIGDWVDYGEHCAIVEGLEEEVRRLELALDKAMGLL